MKGKKGKTGLLYRPACRIFSWQEAWRKRHPGRQSAAEGIKQALTESYGKAKAKELYRCYCIRKNEKLLAVLAGGMGLAGLCCGMYFLDGREAGITGLKRPEAGAESLHYEVSAVLDKETYPGIGLEVAGRELTQEENRELLLLAEQEFYAVMEQEGWQPDAVTEDIAFPDMLCDGRVDVRIESSDYDLIDGAGHVENELLSEEGELACLTVVLSSMEEQRLLEQPVRILPKGQDTASRITRAAKQWLAKADPESGEVSLPEEFEGKVLLWKQDVPFYGGWIVLLTLAGCIVLNTAFDRDLAKEGEKRREELLFAYPSFLSRLTLLVGTGMPVRMAFVRMAKEAEREDASPVYEEIRRTCREMEGGLTELAAYENFGKRCGLSKYRKCASLLSQNVKKGADGLLASLNQEAMNAFEERKALARKKGEEAQTKLLIPMLMMLVVVMLLILAPACFSFGGI